MIFSSTLWKRVPKDLLLKNTNVWCTAILLLLPILNCAEGCSQPNNVCSCAHIHYVLFLAMHILLFLRISDETISKSFSLVEAKKCSANPSTFFPHSTHHYFVGKSLLLLRS